MRFPGRQSQFKASLADCLRRARQLGVIPSRHILVVSIRRQAMGLFQRLPASGAALPIAPAAFDFIKSLRCSTSKHGIGEKAGSNKTPRGLHRVAQKIGGGWPVGAAFKSRQMIGYAWNGLPMAPITTRIFWLDGLEPGFNRGGDVDSHSRYIYIHGTGDEPSLGRPASAGCVQLGGDDLVPLYRQIPVGTLVWISVG